MPQGMNRDQAGARPNGTRGERQNEGARFRGDMERDRTDGGYLPVDRQDDYRMASERDMELEARNRDWSRRDAANTDAGRWDGNREHWREERGRWNEGVERGAGFGRNRQFGGARNVSREYGDPDYGRGYYGGERDMERGNWEQGSWERPFERHPGEYQSRPLRGQDQAERHPRDQHREYHAWREEQLRRMDDEYDAYRRHRQAEFNTHFEQWRQDKLSGSDAARGSYAGQNDKIGATPVEFGGQNATNSGFTRKDDQGTE